MAKSNELFNRKEVDKFIEEEIISKFNFCCKIFKSKSNNSIKLYLGFLPYGTLSNLSDKFTDTEKQIINKNYKLFSEYFIEKLDIHPMLKDRYKGIRPAQCEQIESLVQVSINLYEDENRVKIKELFEACFGLRDKGILPRYLQTEIYGSAK